MNKKYWIYLSIILITTFWLIKSDNQSSIKKANKFEIEDTSLITKIFIADRNGNTITLHKNNEKWIVNDRFIVREEAITTLLSTASKVRIKRPVSKTAFKHVMQFIATTGVYIEFYEDDKILKAYWVGSNNPDHLGTYMLLKDSENPFSVHIPSFNGFLSPRYGIQGNALNIINWRSNTIFNLTYASINHIKYTNYLTPENSYFIKTKPIKLINSQNNSVLFNKDKIIKLLNNFENLNCETFKEGKHKIDFATQIEELVVNSDTLRTYKISELNTTNKEDNFTVNRKYATINNGDLMLIQDYVFNKVLINITELIE